MDRYSRLRGGSSIWSEKNLASDIINKDFFGDTTINSFWIKVSGVWKKCTTWIKVSGVWKQATPNIKITDNWN